MLSRRNLFVRLTAGALAAVLPRIALSARTDFVAHAHAARDAAIAEGDQPYGAVVIKGSQVVGYGPSRVVVNGDPTAHAEMEAIRDAAKRLGNTDLSGCVMYTTSPPCRMCETAAYWARIDRVYTGRAPDDRGAPRYGC
jgi:tRNA(adenine34) deaminase